MNLEFPVTSDPIDPTPTPIITAKMPFSGLLHDNEMIHLTAHPRERDVK